MGDELQRVEAIIINEYNREGKLTKSEMNVPTAWYSYSYCDLVDKDKKAPYGNTHNTILGLSRTLGSRYYELTDHLGNVLATVLDRRTAVLMARRDGGKAIDYYKADVVSASDYYPGGMLMPGRFKEYSWSRMGSQSQQKDDEVYGKGNMYAFKYRMNDTRINRFWSPDPLHGKYPHNSDYAFSKNRLIDGGDLEGLEFYSVHIKEYPDGKRVKMGVVNYTNIKQEGMMNIPTKNGYGPQGDVGVNYTIHKVDADGQEIGKTGFNLKNFYGVYNGPDNPKKYWETPDAKGEYPDDYGLPPIDEADLNGMKHDLDYDALKLRGFSGVMDARSTPPNEAYRERAAKIVGKYESREADVITLQPVTEKTAKAAHKFAEQGIKSFKTAENVKRVLNAAPAPSAGVAPIRP